MIRSTDAQSGVNISKCKWVYNQTAEKIGTNEENYTEGVIPTAQNIQRISLNIKTAGTYYLHLLIVDNAGNAAEIISGEITVENPYPLLATQVNIGDYVAYNDKIDNVKWQVLSKNTSTGEVVLISENSIDDCGEPNEETGIIGRLKIYGANGYLYAEDMINQKCSEYGHGIGADESKKFTYKIGDTLEGLSTETLTGSGARSINIEDINKITGYKPSTGNSYKNLIYYPTRKLDNGYSDSIASKTYQRTYYNYNASEYLTDTNSEIYKILFKNKYYWLASRCVRAQKDNVYFNVCIIGSNKIDSVSVGYGNFSSFDEYSYEYGVRPIVYLKASVKTTGQDSNGAWTIVDE